MPGGLPMTPRNGVANGIGHRRRGVQLDRHWPGPLASVLFMQPWMNANLDEEGASMKRVPVKPYSGFSRWRGGLDGTQSPTKDSITEATLLDSSRESGVVIWPDKWWYSLRISAKLVTCFSSDAERWGRDCVGSGEEGPSTSGVGRAGLSYTV